MPENRRTVAVIDGNSLVHRAFHALPPSMTAPDGRPTNAVYGFTTMLLKMMDDLAPDGVVVAFDKGRPAFRTEILACYKTHRPPTADELKVQFPMVREILEALGVPIVMEEGWEADDLLGTLAEKAKAAGVDVLLVTGDRDALQLVEPGVSVVSTRKGLTDIVVYDAEGVREKTGVMPEQIPDYLGLKGDTSDNIPGVPGVGEKTAAKLISEHGSLDAVLQAAPGIKGKLGENLVAHAQDARDSRVVATIRRDVPVDVDMAAVAWGPFDADSVTRAFSELRFTSLTDRVLRSGAGMFAAEGAPAASAGGQPQVEAGAAGPAWRLLEGEAALRELDRLLETPERWLGVAMDDGGGETLLPREDLAVASDDVVLMLSEAAARAAVPRLLTETRVVTGDTKRLLAEMCPAGSLTVGCADPMEGVDPSRIFDCSLAAYLLESNRGSYDLRGLYGDHLGRHLPEEDDSARRVASEAHAALELMPTLRGKLAETGALDIFQRGEMALVPVLARMEAVGVGVDVAVLRDISVEVAEQIELLRAEIWELAGVEFTIDSPKQLAEVLFDKLGLPPSKRTKTGYSTDATVLEALAESYPICARITAYRELTKLKSTYIDALPRMCGPDGRLHTTFNQTVAATGRLSSSNPNLQNIPVRSELGRRIRAAFVPAQAGDLMVSADYSQIELRILAHLSEDGGLIEAFTSGRDFHAATAARVFGVAPEDVDAEMRRRAKGINFGIVYGISAHGLATKLGMDRAEAQATIDRYFTAYPKVKSFLELTVADAHVKGYAVTMFGRRRNIPELESGNHNLRSFGERTAMNHPMQGTAADIMKLAMVEMDRRLRDAGLVASMVLQVHDELVFESPAEEVDALDALACDVMAGVAELRVPLEVNVSAGKDWASAK